MGTTRLAAAGSALSVALLLLIPAAATAQMPDTTYLSAERADRLVGLYELEDGRAVYVLDLRDQLEGRPTLSMVEYGSGRTRALYPTADGDFEAGNAWFSRDSVEYRVRFDESGERAASLTREEDGASLSGRRVDLVERDVSIRNGDVSLSGTLVLPPDDGPHPVVVMVHGSGPLTRRPQRYVGDLVAMGGVAVLVTDKRGTGRSTGDLAHLTFEAWESDVDAQLDFLRSRPEVDADRMGLFASSESGFVVPAVAARRNDVRFVVCRVCSALPLGRVLEDMGREPEATGPRQTRYLERDPLDAWPEVDVPALVILGERDDRLLVERHQPRFEALRAEGVELELWLVPDATHGLLIQEEGRGIVGYPPDLHDRIVDWIVQTAMGIPKSSEEGPER